MDEFTIWVNNKKIRSTISQFKINFDQIISKVKNDENQNILEQIQKGSIKASLEYGLENVKIDEEARKELFVLNSLSEAVSNDETT